LAYWKFWLFIVFHMILAYWKWWFFILPSWIIRGYTTLAEATWIWCAQNARKAPALVGVRTSAASADWKRSGKKKRDAVRSWYQFFDGEYPSIKQLTNQTINQPINQQTDQTINL
jgi:hypothetical protein